MRINKIFTLSWYIFFIIYLLLFLICLAGTVTTIDDYNGGDKVAEICNSLFPIFFFPAIVLDYFGLDISSKYAWIYFILFIVNFFINSIVLTTLFNHVYLKFRRILHKKVR